MKIFFYMLIVTLFLSSCSKRMDSEAEAYVRGMTLANKIGQLMMFAVPGREVDEKNRKIIEQYKPGGVILFGYNISTGKRLKNFIEDMQALAHGAYGIPLFVTTDQEAGRVRRVTDGVEQFPGNLASGVSGNYNLVYEMARIKGLQLRQLGINMNLTPVLDVNNNPENPVINTRSFGSDPEVVASMGVSYIKGLGDGKCISVAKHFPGHGDTSSDSHFELPVIRHTMNHLENNELIPFERAIKEDVDCIMSAHILYPNVVNDKSPATLSPFFLTDILRKKYRFRGIVMTDDLEMNAVSLKMSLGEAAVKSFRAGSDIILISTFGDNIPDIYNSLLKAVKSGVISEERLNLSVQRIIELKLRYKIAALEKDEKHLKALTFNPEEEDEGYISRAEEVNAKLSEEALYLRGGGPVFEKGKSFQRIFVSKNKAFRKALKLKRGDYLVESPGHIHEVFKKVQEGKKVQVVYQFHNSGKGLIKKLAKKYNSGNSSMVLVYSGNPFALGSKYSDCQILFTFSPTDMSMRQAAEVFNGKIVPGSEVNCDLGLR